MARRDASSYSRYDTREQVRRRMNVLAVARSDWLATVEQIEFEYTMLGVSAIPFSGDHRPVLHG